jgi:hypothetical protein
MYEPFERDDIYVCPECGKSQRLPVAYIMETIDATECFCLSGYDRHTTEMINVSEITREDD